MSALDALGWFGSALLVVSLLQASILRLRVLNTIACIILIVFNAWLEIWPMVAMNVALAAINVYFIVSLLRERASTTAYTVLQTPEDGAFLEYFVNSHRAEITEYFPAFSQRQDRIAFLILRGDEAIGAVILRDAGGGTAQVDLDYVTPKYRDFKPGEFVFRQSGLFRNLGFSQILTPPGMVEPYYARLGFTKMGDRFHLDVNSAG